MKFFVVTNSTTIILSLLLMCSSTTQAYVGFSEEFAKYKLGLKSKGGVFSNVVREEWARLKSAIGCSTADILGPNTFEEVEDWRNSASTEAEALTLASFLKEPFQRLVEDATKHVPGVVASFGPDNCCMVKSSSSIETKFKIMVSQGEDVPASTIFDLLRGTVIVNDIPSLRSILTALLQAAKAKGYPIHLQNRYLWDGFPGGYVGHHLLIYLNHEGKSIIGEVQVHFRDITDGTQDCPKEFAHKTYVKLRALEHPTSVSEELKLDQELAFAFGMSRVPAYHISHTRLQTCPLPQKSVYALREGRIYKSSGPLQLSSYVGKTHSWVEEKDAAFIEEVLHNAIMLTERDAQTFLKKLTGAGTTETKKLYFLE